MDNKLQDVIRKVEALLERANNTDFPEEAKSCQQKAQELMTKFQVEESSLFGSCKTETIINRKIEVSTPFTIDKISLLNNIARENFCRVLRGKNYAVIYGYESDIELVLTMYRMLLNTMIIEMMTELDKFRGTLDSQLVSTISWKKSFFAGYAQTIGQRLREAKKNQVDSVAKSTGNDKFALVLKSKEQSILDYWETIDKLPGSTRSVSSNSGYGAGKSSAGRADLGQTRVTSTRALTK